MDPITQTLAWRVGDDEYALVGADGAWTLTAPGATLTLATPALTALADALGRLGLASRRAPRHQRAGRPWTDEEDAALEGEHQAGLTRRAIAAAHGRSVGAVTARLVRLGLEAPSAAPPLPSGRLQRALAAD